MGLPFPLRWKPDSTFGSVILDDTYESSHMLAMPQTLGPVRLGAGESEACLTVRSTALRLRVHCRRASQRAVTSPPDLLGYCRWDGRSGRVTTPDNHRDDFQVAPTQNIHRPARDIGAFGPEGARQISTLLDPFRTGVDGRNALNVRELFGKERYESPAHQQEFPRTGFFVVSGNLSVTGSLATILWLLALRKERLNVSFWKFLRVGAVAMPVALLAALGGLIAMNAFTGK